MSQPLPENGPPRIQRKFKIDAEEPSEDSRTERPTPKVRAGLPQRGTKNMRRGKLKMIKMLQNYSNSSAARSDTKISKGKSATVTTQGRSSIAATQPRKKTCEPNTGYDSAQKIYITMFHHPGTHTKLMVRHAPI